MVNGVIYAFLVNDISDTGSTYYNNVGNLGSVYHFSSVTEINIQEAEDGEEVETSFTEIHAHNNYAKYGGVMYILEKSDLSFGSCTFSNNQAS
jgi:hypothetical protein